MIEMFDKTEVYNSLHCIINNLDNLKMACKSRLKN